MGHTVNPDAKYHGRIREKSQSKLSHLEGFSLNLAFLVD